GRAPTGRGRGPRPARPGWLVPGPISAERGEGGARPPQADSRGRLPPLPAIAVRPAAARRSRGDPLGNGGPPPPLPPRAHRGTGEGGRRDLDGRGGIACRATGDRGDRARARARGAGAPD